jgi:hypothetical protein
LETEWQTDMGMELGVETRSEQWKVDSA